MTPRKTQRAPKGSANKASSAPTDSAITVANTGNEANGLPPVPPEAASPPPPLSPGSALKALLSLPAARAADGAPPTTSTPQASPAGLIRAANGAAAVHQTVGEKKRGRRLRTIRNVKAGLGHLIRELEAKRIQPKEANALTYAYSALAGVMGADVTKELEEMKETLARVKGSRFDA